MIRKKQTILLSLIIFLGIILRLPYLIKYHFAINMDEAVKGIMAQDILHGATPLFFYGQQYFGPLESMFTAPLFLVFPDNILTLRISILILTFISLIIFWRGLCLITQDHNGIMALGWLILSPIVLSVYSVLPRSHMGGLFCGSLVFYLAARIINSKNNYGLDFFLYGFFIGFGLWMHPGTLIYVIATGLIILLNNPRIYPAIISSFLGCLAGGFPFWIKTIEMHFGTFNFGQGTLGRETIFPFVKDLWQSVLNMNTFLGYDLLPAIISVMVWVGIVAILISSFILLLKRKGSGFPPRKLVLIFAWLVIALTLFAYSYTHASRFGFVSYRYYFPILIGLAFIFALIIAEIRKRSKRLGLLLFLGLIVINLWTGFLGFKNQTYLRYEVHFEEKYLLWKNILPYLGEKEIIRAYIEFFDEGPLNFVSRGKFIGSTFYNSWYPRYSLIVDGTPDPAFIFRNPDEAELFRQGIDLLGSKNYLVLQTPNYRIFSNIKASGEIYKPIDRKGIQIRAYPDNHLAAGVLDGNMATTWSTKESQNGDEYLFLDLGREAEVARVDLISKWHDHLPVHVVIDTSLDNRHWKEAVNVETSSTLYWTGEHPGYKVLEGFNEYIFSKKKTRYIRIKQIGSHPNPWELAEIYLYASEEGGKTNSAIDYGAIMAFLKEKGIKRIISDLFFSANIIRRSNDKITANVRYNEAYPEDIRSKWEYSAEEIEAVAVHQRDLEGVREFFNDQRWHYQFQTFGVYTLIYKLKSPLSTMNRLAFKPVKIIASHNEKDTPLMNDQNKDTVWKSLTPRRVGMFVGCDLKKTEKVSGIILDPGANFQDVVHNLKIYYSPDGFSWVEVNNAHRFHQKIRWTGSHLIGSGTSSVYTFLPVETRYLKIVCLEEDRTFYWSIAELSILGLKKNEG